MPPQAHAGREWWREVWPQWAQWAPAHGESWIQSLKSMSFCFQQIRFQANCSFYLPLSALCRSLSVDTLRKTRFCIFDRRQIFFVVSSFLFLFFYVFSSALPLIHLAEEGRDEAACPCPTQWSSRMPQTDKTRDIWLKSREIPAEGLWDAHHISEFTKRSFLHIWQKRGSSPADPRQSW